MERRTFPMTELVIDELELDDKKEGREIAREVIKQAKQGNASILKLLYDRVQPPDTLIEPNDEPLTDEQRLDGIIRLVERVRKKRDLPVTRS